MSTEITSAGQQTLNYMTLLITQLQNQNPLDPMDNQQMAAQLAQFSQLELTEEMNANLDTLNTSVSGMNSSFEGSLWMAQLDYAKSLLGKTVNFYDSTSGTTMEGSVKKLTFDSSGNPVLTVKTSGDGAGEHQISVSQIEGIQAD
jgi:flagellar basal-body rod modification protein FlgD